MGHSNHISNLSLSYDNLKYIENKDRKWFLGHYLNKKLKNNYRKHMKEKIYLMDNGLV